jgi:hypothetical protein
MDDGNLLLLADRSDCIDRTQAAIRIQAVRTSARHRIAIMTLSCKPAVKLDNWWL